MNPRPKISALLAAALALALAACAPSSSGTEPDEDRTSGTVRVWLFQEVNNGPKEQVVKEAVDAFAERHGDAEVEVTYIPIETRAERIKAAFNDPGSAPDVVEYGNTDTAGYVADGGLADITEEFRAWKGSAGIADGAKESVTVDGKVYGVPWFVGVRALYYRTDVFRELNLRPPASLEEVADTARRIRAAKPDLYGLAVGGAYTYGALPFLWAHGGELAEPEGGKGWRSALAEPAAREGVAAWTGLFGDDNCPAAKCAEMGGNDTVQAFASGKAGMAIGGDFSRRAMEDGAVKGKYAVVPLPGVEKGSIAPAFAGGNNLGVLRSSDHRSLAVDFVRLLGGAAYQEKMFEAMGNLPTDSGVRRRVAEKDPFTAPFVRTLESGTRFVPASPAWGSIDASLVLPTMFQQVITGRKSVDAATADAARKMDSAFADAAK
ncbi:extracellular solute-binding protein [Streptomyces capparidis]